MAGTFRLVAVGWILLGVMLATGSCGNRAMPSGHPLPPETPSYLEELSALSPPPGVDERLFAHLKQVFARALEKHASGEVVPGPPTGTANIVDDLHAVDEGGGRFRLEWHYRNCADFDQNGAVRVSDLSPLALHFGHVVGTDPQDIVIDASGNGKVGIEDVSQVAMHYLQEVGAYSVRRLDTATETYLEVGRVEFADASSDETSFLLFSWDLPTADPAWYRVVPLDTHGNPGVEGQPYYFEPAGEEPEITSVSPQSAAADSSVQFTAEVTGSEPLDYFWNFGDAASPPTSMLPAPTVEVLGVGDYECALTVSNYLAEDTLHFNLTVGEPPEVISVTPTEGQTGAALQFSATVSGTPPFDYYWDFGDGASPSLSEDPSPTATLGAPGAYEASLTLGSGFGECFFPFTLTVTEIPPGNRITISASSTDVSVGGTTSILVSAEDMTYPFSTLSSAILAYDLSLLEPDTGSFNLGSPGGAVWDLDGIWALDSYAVLPTPAQYFFQNQEGSEWVYHEHPENPYLHTVDVSIPVLEGSLPERASGDLFGFDFTGVSGGAVPLTFVRQYTTSGGTVADGTFYIEPGGTHHLYTVYGRVVINVHPPATVAPAVNWVYPLSADTGSSQTFQVGVSGSPPFSYSWDFGSGAAPSTSTDVLPQVTMGPPGEYGANVTVTGPGGQDSHNFNYRIPHPDYDEIEHNDSFTGANAWSSFPFAGFRGSIGPGGYDGDEEDFYTFTAAAGQFFEVVLDDESGAGDITLALYDSSETQVATSAGTGSVKTLSYLCASGGPYYVRVSAGPAGADYLLRGYLRAPQAWSSTVISDLDTPPDAASLTVIGIYPAVAYSHNPDLDSGSQLYYSMNSNATGSGTWTTYQVGTDERGYGACLANIGGYPGIAYTNDDGVVRYASCDNQDGSGVWSGYDISEAGHQCHQPSLVEVEGYPAIAYYDETLPGLVYAICDNSQGSGNWTRVSVHTGAEVGLSPSLKVLNDDHPGISYFDGTSGDLWLAYSGTLDGIGGWTAHLALASVNASIYRTSLTVTAAHPAVAFSSGDGIGYTINSAEDATGSWSLYPPPHTDSAGYGFALKRYNGRPAIIYQGPLDTLRYASNPESDGSGAWDWWVASENARMIGGTVYAIVSGRPACVYYDIFTGELKYTRQPTT